MPSSEESIDVVCVDDNGSLAELTATFLERHDDTFTPGPKPTPRPFPSDSGQREQIRI